MHTELNSDVHFSIFTFPWFADTTSFLVLNYIFIFLENAN